jgi:uncharacterized FAD-dependent dehydrogenase
VIWQISGIRPILTLRRKCAGAIRNIAGLSNPYWKNPGTRSNTRAVKANHVKYPQPEKNLYNPAPTIPLVLTGYPMLRLTEIKIPLNQNGEQTDAVYEQALRQRILQKLNIDEAQLLTCTVFRRAYDARQRRQIFLVYTVDIDTTCNDTILARFKDDPHVKPAPDTRYQFVGAAPAGFGTGDTAALRPVVIGFGPCGLFAALLLAQMGFKPIVLERGKDVRRRTKDTWGLWRKRKLNEDSNVQFGEGGAGTFSDGKLYSQIKDPGFRGRKVLTEFVQAGAPEEIIFVSKPHIGTFKLVTVIENMRQTITELGGEIRFESRVSDLHIEQGQVRGLTLSDGSYLATNHVVLAVGHSARDTFQMLHDRGVYIEPKAFSIGFRAEHPQSMIDTCRFGDFAGNPLLGAADYKLVHHCKNGRSVYSFCMCPGGTVVAATSEAERVVTNGMSQYSRNERNANAAIVVGITPEDFPGSPLAGIDFQRELESKAYQLGGKNYNAPGQLIGDFIAGRPSSEFGTVIPSYKPGVTLGDLSQCLPAYAIDAIREALPAFDKKIKGFAMHDAVLTGVETRTSSPIRIKRGPDYQSINTAGLYPAGEGAGYAGGILSAGVDGIEVAEAIANAILTDTAVTSR